MRRPRTLLPAWMLEVRGSTRRPGRIPTPPTGRARLASERAEARIEALTKLKALFDSGVLTRQQFADERERLLGG